MFAKALKICFVAVVISILSFTQIIFAQEPKVQVFLPVISGGIAQESEEDLFDAEYEQIKVLLEKELRNTIPNIQYNNHSYNWIRQDDDWIYGYVLASINQSAQPDGYIFLVNKLENNISVAYMYTQKFDEWVDLLPDNIIPAERQKYFYSSAKSAHIAGDLASDSSSDPQLSFPWREGYSWRFNGGPHNNAGSGVTKEPWSGLDFGIPYQSATSDPTDTTVVTSRDGYVLIIEPNCAVTIGYEDGWSLRYLHVSEITVFEGQFIERGTKIAKVDTDNPCYLGPEDGPHLHLGLKYNGDFTDFDGKYIGGWLVNKSTSIYQGTLTLGSIATLPASSTKVGRGSSYVENRGFIGSQWFIGPVVYKKPTVGVGVCIEPNSCYQLNTGSVLQTSSTNQISYIMPAKGYMVEFRKDMTLNISTANTDATNVNFSCLDFDVTDFQNYNFPNTNLKLKDYSTDIQIQQGTCNPNDRPTKTGSTTSPTNPTPTEPSTNYGCNNQTTGVKFLNNSGSCFYMTAGKASLPFSPTKIEVLDTVRKYDISICNAKGECDEFNNSASIDHSSVSRPFTRVEVTPQGLVSSDAVGSCKTSTGRKVQFSTMQNGVKYYTDRSYTVKNVDKLELIGMKFLMTPNDDKYNGDPEYITCDIKKTTQIVIAIDGRVRTLSSWMRSMPYERMNREIGVTDNDMQHFDLYACTQKAGYKLRLGGPQSDGSSNIKSNYIIIFRDAAQEKATDCSAKFNVPPDQPVLKSVEVTTTLTSAPLLEWSMSDRNFTDDYLEAYVKVWKDDQLISTPDWLPIGVTQWIPLWNDPGSYRAQVVVRDSKGIEVLSNEIQYQLSAPIEACVVYTN